MYEFFSNYWFVARDLILNWLWTPEVQLLGCVVVLMLSMVAIGISLGIGIQNDNAWVGILLGSLFGTFLWYIIAALVVLIVMYVVPVAGVAGGVLLASREATRRLRTRLNCPQIPRAQLREKA